MISRLTERTGLEKIFTNKRKVKVRKGKGKLKEKGVITAEDTKKWEK